MKRLILGDAELDYQLVEPGQRRLLGVQLIQQRLEFVLTREALIV